MPKSGTIKFGGLGSIFFRAQLKRRESQRLLCRVEGMHFSLAFSPGLVLSDRHLSVKQLMERKKNPAFCDPGRWCTHKHLAILATTQIRLGAMKTTQPLRTSDAEAHASPRVHYPPAPADAPTMVSIAGNDSLGNPKPAGQTLYQFKQSKIHI